MAEDRPDQSQKTEEPTQKKLQEARDKGQIARSQEVNHWFMILSFAIVVGYMAPGVVSGIARILTGVVAGSHAMAVDAGGLPVMVADYLAALAWQLVPPIGLAFAAAATAGVIQTGFVLSTEPVKPKLEKISPLGGLRRLFSARAIAEFAKGILKLAVVASVVALMLWPERHLIPVVVSMEPAEFLAVVQSLGLKVLLAVLAVMTLIAGLDFLFQRYQHTKQLRMSKQEVKDEFKQTEGDPMVRARLRQIRMERARQRMMAAVPESDVVIANPTHFAVALQYELGSTGAPKLTAKGVDSLALRIRELAEQCDVPVVENPPLARALYDGVELDQEIPPEHYKAVAEIISYVFKLKGRMPSRPSGRAAAAPSALPSGKR